MSELQVGGQAVIEGVMMRSPRCLAVAVRTPDHGILLRQRRWISLADRWRLLRKPFLRGVLVLAESLHNGLSALQFSAMVQEAALKENGAQPGSGGADRGEAPTEKPASLWITFAVAIVLALGLFAALPHFITWGIGALASSEALTSGRSVWFHLVDGVVKLVIFIGYVYLISLMPDVRRVFMYHGAEHKAIRSWENGEPLTVDNARKHSTLHPRCGTSFLLVVLLAAVLIFSVVFPFVPAVSDVAALNQAFFVLVKLLLLFPIAGLAYEVIRLAGRKPDNPWLYWAVWPGLMTQKITTREPDDGQLEVALASLRAVLAREKGFDAGDTGAAEETQERFDSFEALVAQAEAR